MRVQHKNCGSANILSCTLVPRMMAVVSWYLNPNGSVEPDEYGQDDAMWDMEIADPDGDYWCNHCNSQFNAVQLEIIHEPEKPDPTS